MKMKSIFAGIFWAFFCFLIASDLISSPTTAQQAGLCRENATEVITSGTNLRIRDYICDTPGNARIRVQLHRLSDTVADALIQGTLPEALQPVIGKARIVKNPVSETFTSLLDQFGQTQRNFCEQVEQAAPEGQSASISNRCEGKGQVNRRMLTGWGGGGGDLPAVADMKYLLEKNQLPPWYQPQPNQSSTNISGWRPMTKDDLTDLETKIRQFNALASRAKLSEHRPNIVNESRYIRLYRHLTGGRPPKGFSTVEASLSYLCGDEGREWMIYYTGRSMMVEVAIIENLSQKPVRLTDFEGVVARTEKLRRSRQLDDIKTTSPQPLGTAPIELGPREKIVLFQRMKLVAVYQPEYTRLPIFDYGPSHLVRRFAVDGEQVTLDRRGHNAALLTMSAEEGSCPYLFVHEDDVWVDHGKVLEKAKGESLKQWDNREFEGFRGSFRLTELEPELAIIDQAVLDVTLKTGETLSLRPDRRTLADADDRAETIYMHESVDLHFGLPSGLATLDVLRSKLRLLGHYERYSTIFRSAGLMPEEPKPQFCIKPARILLPGDAVRLMVAAN